jgi:uncharacterized membrane protein YhhN
MIRRDIMRGALAALLLTAFNVALAALIWRAVPEQNKDIIVYMLGQLSGMVTLALGYYFSTSKSSAEKTDALAAAAKDRQDEA